MSKLSYNKIKTDIQNAISLGTLNDNQRLKLARLLRPDIGSSNSLVKADPNGIEQTIQDYATQETNKFWTAIVLPHMYAQTIAINNMREIYYFLAHQKSTTNDCVIFLMGSSQQDTQKTWETALTDIATALEHTIITVEPYSQAGARGEHILQIVALTRQNIIRLKQATTKQQEKIVEEIRNDIKPLMSDISLDFLAVDIPKPGRKTGMTEHVEATRELIEHEFEVHRHTIQWGKRSLNVKKRLKNMDNRTPAQEEAWQEIKGKTGNSLKQYLQNIWYRRK